MSIFAIYNHYSPFFIFINGFYQIFYGKIFFLNIYIRHTDFVKVLYFIVGVSHMSDNSRQTLKIKRWKHKSNATVFHTVKGRAVLTSTHQRVRYG